jgi:hypothetical protein
MVLLLFFAAGSTACMAQGIKNKAIKKECKRMTKQLKKEGWKVFDTTSTDLNAAVQAFYEALEAGGSNVQSLTATGTASNMNMAKSKAKAHAAQDYAGQLRSEVESITNVEVQNIQNGETVSSQKDMKNSLTVKVEQMVKGMTPMLTLRREIDGKTEVQMLYIVKHISLDETNE